MGYACYEVGGKPCGYGVDAVCEADGCGAEIHRGLAYACGGEPGGGEHYCDGYFCDEHLFVVLNGPKEDQAPRQLCSSCLAEWERLYPDEAAS